MERWFLMTRKRTALAAGIALIALMAQRPALAQGAAPDPLKFTSASPVIIGWQVKADKTKDFEDFWTGLKAVLAKDGSSAELKALGESLNKIYKVNVPPFADAQGNQIVIYLFHLDPPSTALSYNPSVLIYTDPNGLRAALENSKIPRAEADALYDKIKSAVASINPIWPLSKIGG
jgi:hypothetical protein